MMAEQNNRDALLVNFGNSFTAATAAAAFSPTIGARVSTHGDVKTVETQRK